MITNILKTIFKSGITHITDLPFDLNITESYSIITKKMKKQIFWYGQVSHLPYRPT